MFKPKGERSQWKQLYDAIKDEPLGRIYDFDELKEILGIDIRKSRTVIYQTNKHLLMNHEKMLINDRKQGYHLGTIDEQLTHAKRRIVFGTRDFKKGKTETDQINKSQATPEQIDFQFKLSLRFDNILSVARKRQAEAIKSQEKALDEQREAQKAIKSIEKEVAELKRKMTTTQ